MGAIVLPRGYQPCLSLYETQMAIGVLRRTFEDKLSAALNLKRVSAPLFVQTDSGLNDDLSGVERPVSFYMKATDKQAQVVHSLAKWKRMALGRYGFGPGEGMYTDMNAIRRDEDMDALHSVYVDQWDWERVLDTEQRNVAYLKQTVRTIVNVMCSTLDVVKNLFPALPTQLNPDVAFVTTQELEDAYPTKTPKEREDLYLKEHSTAFIMQIGDKLASGTIHDHRAPDYDDWSLNGDIMVYNELLGRAFEISSMGIRVDPKTLDEQLIKANAQSRLALPFHKALMQGSLPLTIGGGIGQSRTCMLLLGKAHIGEVQASIWDEANIAACKEAGIVLL